VLGADAPHQRILELFCQMVVDLLAHGLHGGATSAGQDNAQQEP
jgi:hypothetical protein